MTREGSPKPVTGAYVTDMLVIQSAMLLRLSRMDSIDIRQIGAVMGEIGSLYLSLSEMIRNPDVQGPATDAPAYPWIDGVWTETAHPWKSRLD
jgi:hypothetical protein